MGWKRVRDHYRIEHSVSVHGDGICIGSAYIPGLIVIAPNGTVETSALGLRDNDDLSRLFSELRANPAQLRRLIAEPDTFARDIPVYTYDGATIIEKFCETPGWPNVTHDGEMMYDNAFSTNRDQVVRWARRDAEAAAHLAELRIAEAEKGLALLRSRLANARKVVAQLGNATTNG